MPEPNPERRDPEEPRALTAVEASVRAYARAFPYLSWRFGVRGLRLMRDDNAHLMALAESQEAEFGRQVRWTADLLSQRGVPRWMFEVNLELMARAIGRALPDRPEIPMRLKRAAAGLARQRRAAITEGNFRRCSEAFANALGPGHSQGRLWVGFGSIITAAVADERGGVGHAIARVHEWAADPRRFGSRWIDAVEQTIEHSRRL